MEINWVIPGRLAVGPARDVQKLRQEGFRSIVCVATGDFPGKRRRLPLSDSGKKQSAAGLLRAVKSVHRRVSNVKRSPVYLHCRAGKNRSCVVAALYLVYIKAYASFGKAMTHVKRVRPQAAPWPTLYAKAKELSETF